MRRVGPVTGLTASGVTYSPDGTAYVDVNPGSGTPGSTPGAKLATVLLEELTHLVEFAGLTPSADDTDLHQVRQAVTALIQAGSHAVAIRPATFAAGVTDGKPVRWDAAAGKFALAQADSTANDLAVGIADVTNGAVYAFGETRSGLVSGLTPGARYYLGAAGGLTTTAPTDAVMVGIAKAADVLFVDIDTGVVSGIGKHQIPVNAGAMVGRITGAPEPSAYETSTNKDNVRCWNFDAAAVEYVQFMVPMPKSWNLGTLTAQLIWSHPAATTNFGVSWAIQAVAMGDGDAGDAAFGAAIQVNDTGGTTDAIYMTAETGAITVAGTPAAGDVVLVQVYRVATDATYDTLAVDARLIGLRLYYTTSAATDA